MEPPLSIPTVPINIDSFLDTMANPQARSFFKSAALELFPTIHRSDVAHLDLLLTCIPEPILPELRDKLGRNCLHIACYYGRFEAVVKLYEACPALLAKADCDTSRGGLPIHYAAWGGNTQIVDYLIARGASLDDRDLVGNTPFLYVFLSFLLSQSSFMYSSRYSIYGGHLDLIRILLSRGRRLAESNHKQHTPIIQASCGGHKDVVDFLLKNGASLDERDELGNSALLFAAWAGHLDLVKHLLSLGASLSEVSQTGHTALLSAANSGSLEVVKFLLLETSVTIEQRNENGDSCILLAAFGGHIELLQWLLDYGAPISDTNKDGLDPLLSACNGGRREMVEYLLDLGLDLQYRNPSGYSPLILAACGTTPTYVANHAIC